MRPRLASLALLLLALCRSAVSDSSPWVQSSNIQSSDSTVSVAGGTQTKVFKSVVQVPDDAKAEETKAKLMEYMGNTLIAIALKSENKYKTAPAYFKDALNNGVRCEVEDEAALETKIITTLYGSAAGFTAAIQADEQKKAKEAPNLGISCDAGKEDDCLCVKKKPLIFCLASNLKKEIEATNVQKKPCLKKTLEDLKTKGRKALVEKMEKVEVASFMVAVDPADPLKGFTEPAAKADVYCDALNSEVIPLVVQAYASDAAFWFMDAVFIAEMTKGSADLDTTCADEDAKKDPIAKCVCEGKKMGVLPCLAQVMGKVFKDAGYLDCAATPAKFVDAKKREALVEVGKVMGGGPAPGAPTGAPGGNETTTAATGGAATSSSLLLAPLAAAAAALLL